jgi:pimeloyl-ACP methyl ester carboxylesterase
MPFVQLEESPHARGVVPVPIYYRDAGHGKPIVFLHGGWGYGIYSIARQIEALQGQARFIVPDRSGHGRSAKFPGPLPTDFHRRAADETLLVLEALGIARAVLWGHSDGAVIAAMIGLTAPQRCEHLVLEAFHFYRRKPASQSSFFEKFADPHHHVTGKMAELLKSDHGPENWENVVRRNCRAWLELAAQSTRPDEDLYDGQLGGLRVPVTFIHGRSDPRTEPGEMKQVQESIPAAEMHFIANGRHSPHSEEAASQECTEILRGVIARNERAR